MLVSRLSKLEDSDKKFLITDNADKAVIAIIAATIKIPKSSKL